MATRTALPTTKLDPGKTVRVRNRRTGRLEVIEAISADGRWGYGREDDRGTRWYLRDLRTGEHIPHSFGTLVRARRWTHHQDAAATTAQPLAS